MNPINFSIIIPHKNIPNLLLRCINSIPHRDDIQIIIVDDNSDPQKVNFKQFPGINKKNVEIYFTKENKGAGYARNVGLSHAKGHWILFADADDFYTENISFLLDTYLYSDYDIIYFNAKSVYSDTLEEAERNLQVKKFFDLNEIENFKYSFYPPWCKMIKHKLITKNQITFSETLAANDAMFSVKIGWYSNNVKLDSCICYCITLRRGSLEQTKNVPILKDRIYISLEINKFYKEHSILRNCNFYFFHLLTLLRINKKEFINSIKLCNSYGYSYAFVICKLMLLIINRIFSIIVRKLANKYKK